MHYGGPARSFWQWWAKGFIGSRRRQAVGHALQQFLSMTVLFAAIDVATWENDRYTYALQIALIALIAYPAGLLLSRVQSERLIEHQWALWGVSPSSYGEALRASYFGAAPTDPYVRSSAIRFIQIHQRRALSPLTVWLSVAGLAAITGFVRYALPSERPSADWFGYVSLLAAVALYTSAQPWILRRRLTLLLAGERKTPSPGGDGVQDVVPVALPRLDSNQEPSD